MDKPQSEVAAIYLESWQFNSDSDDELPQRFE